MTILLSCMCFGGYSSENHLRLRRDHIIIIIKMESNSITNNIQWEFNLFYFMWAITSPEI